MLIQKKILIFFPLFLTTIFFIFLFFGVKNQSQALYFQDETEHITLGWMITDYHKDLYTFLSTNHQPLPILFSVFTKFIPYSTLFEFIDRIRVFMWVFALGSSLFLSIRFRYKGAIASIITYSLAHYFFGWHVLAESITLPAVLYSILFLLSNFTERRKKIVRLNSILFGLSCFWMVFNLVVLWPFVLISIIFYTYKIRKIDFLFLFSFFVLTMFLFLYINPFDWFRESVFNNIKYFIPFEPKNGFIHYLKIIIYPAAHVAYLKSIIGRYYLISIVLIAQYFFVLKNYFYKKTTKKKVIKLIMNVFAIFILITSLNTRISDFNVMFYNGFHLYSYIAGLSAIASICLVKSIEVLLKNKNFFGVFVIIIMTFLLVINNTSWVFENRNKLSDYYIKYDTFQAYGTALKIIKKPTDSLMTGPDGVGYLNMMADIPTAGKQNFHLEWSYRVPYLRDYWIDMVNNNQPTFIYFNLDQNSHSKILKPIIEKHYAPVVRKSGDDTLLYMKKESINDVFEEQWVEFEEQLFEKPVFTVLSE